MNTGKTVSHGSRRAWLAGLLYGRIWSGTPWPAETWLGAALLVAGVLLAVRIDKPIPKPAPV